MLQNSWVYPLTVRIQFSESIYSLETCIPYQLTGAVKLQRVQCCQAIEAFFNGLGDAKYSVYAVEDETQILFNEPPTNQVAVYGFPKEKKDHNV